MRFASIDIGSNAVRLLLCNVYDDGKEAIFKKAELVRMPIRLGEDVFRIGSVSQEKIQALCKTMKAFRLLIEVFGAKGFRACATAAMREAANAAEVIAAVRKESGITIEVIDGKSEAEIIYSNHIAEHLDPERSYLYIDVGGGSTELTLFEQGHVVASQSFNIGSIRLLHDKVTKEDWAQLKNWIHEHHAGHDLMAIGSGGNINKIFKLSERKEGKALSLLKLTEIYYFLKQFSVEERITRLGLNPDRADVIVPAAKVFITIMREAGIEKIIVPQIGLSDGIVHLLYEDFIASGQGG
ncbi:MAG: exopolyphosphatase [Sphingobacteriales bacterium]|jgi:exopolyphosphatase/guanosine-5'-triphosphate,3'-diphosphate pyrophosphatase|nr:exopolyphosphatase [Sphingobacteriales bacterium]